MTYIHAVKLDGINIFVILKCLVIFFKCENGISTLDFNGLTNISLVLTEWRINYIFQRAGPAVSEIKKIKNAIGSQK